MNRSIAKPGEGLDAVLDHALLQDLKIGPRIRNRGSRATPDAPLEAILKDIKAHPQEYIPPKKDVNGSWDFRNPAPAGYAIA